MRRRLVCGGRGPGLWWCQAEMQVMSWGCLVQPQLPTLMLPVLPSPLTSEDQSLHSPPQTAGNDWVVRLGRGLMSLGAGYGGQSMDEGGGHIYLPENFHLNLWKISDWNIIWIRISNFNGIELMANSRMEILPQTGNKWIYSLNIIDVTINPDKEE